MSSSFKSEMQLWFNNVEFNASIGAIYVVKRKRKKRKKKLRYNDSLRDARVNLNDKYLIIKKKKKKAVFQRWNLLFVVGPFMTGWQMWIKLFFYFLWKVFTLSVTPSTAPQAFSVLLNWIPIKVNFFFFFVQCNCLD